MDIINKITLLCIFIFTSIIINAQQFAKLPELNYFSFISSETKTLAGKTPEKGAGGIIYSEDQIGQLGIVSLFYQNACYTDGRYNHNNFKVEHGKITNTDGTFSFDAYKIYEPESKAAKFLASQHVVYYRFPTKVNYSVYMLSNEKVEKVKDIAASDINIEKHIKIEGLTVSSLQGSAIYFFVPSNKSVSPYTNIAKGVEAAKIKQLPFGILNKYRFAVNGTVYNSPNSAGSRKRQFFLMNEPREKMGVVWQDQNTKEIFHTIFGTNLKSFRTNSLPNNNKAVLVAATNDSTGNVYYFTVKSSIPGNVIAKMYKVSLTGNISAQKVYDTSNSGLNIYNFSDEHADMEYLSGKIALMIARTMHKSYDGLNHQGGIAVVFDANSLEILKNSGQTSGHSFDNYLTTNTEGKFLGIDMGDNYPRGLNLHKFDDVTRLSRVVYTYKTLHGTSSGYNSNFNYPVYSEISDSKQTFYKWSNDNATYSEIGAVIEFNDGYMVLFIGEPDSEGKALNNAHAGSKSKDPRNIGFVKVRKDFENAEGYGSQVSDDLVVSKGIKEEGGFYTFGGKWSEQRNAGVNWLTNYVDKSSESARNLKAIKLQNDNILLIWELFSQEGYYSDYKNTMAMVIDKNGKKMSQAVELGYEFRLHRRDDLLLFGNSVILASGNQVEGMIELMVLEIK